MRVDNVQPVCAGRTSLQAHENYMCCAVLCCAVLCCKHKHGLQAAAEVAHAANVPIWFEPVSVPKSVRASKVLGLLTFISPNAHELIAMALAVDPTHNADLAQQLLLQMAAGSQISAAGQLKLLTPFLLSVLKVGLKMEEAATVYAVLKAHANAT